MADWEIKPIAAITETAKKYPWAIAGAGVVLVFALYKGLSSPTAQETDLALPPLPADEASGLPGSTGAAVPDYSGMTEDLMAFMAASVQVQQENQTRFLEDQAKANASNIAALVNSLSGQLSLIQTTQQIAEQKAPTTQVLQTTQSQKPLSPDVDLSSWGSGYGGVTSYGHHVSQAGGLIQTSTGLTPQKTADAPKASGNVADMIAKVNAGTATQADVNTLYSLGY